VKITTNFKGYFFACLAATTYGLNPLFALPLYRLGFDVDNVLLWRYFYAVLILGIFFAVTRRPVGLAKRQIIPMISCGICMTISSITLYRAFSVMDVSISVTLLFVYPIIVALVNVIGFHEKIRLSTVLGVILSLLGVIALCKSDGQANVNLEGIVCSILSAFAYAFYMIIVRETSIKTLPSSVLTFYCLGVGILIFLFRIIVWGIVPFFIHMDGLGMPIGYGNLAEHRVPDRNKPRHWLHWFDADRDPWRTGTRYRHPRWRHNL
jgi:drug/metabolite transporter (DMT)-like permease